jgi:signal transduction histidine kinase
MKNKTAGGSMFRFGIIFVAAIMIPGLVLSLIALRAARHEEAFIEKQLHTTYSAELTQTVYGIQQLIIDIQKFLDTTAPEMLTPDAGSTIMQWDSSVALVDVPYIFNRTGAFEWPDEKRLSVHERDFITFNTDFFMDRKPVEVYRSISDDYADALLATKDKAGAGKKQSSATLRQRAASEFENNLTVQKKMYKEVRGKGKIVPLRNIVSGSKTAAKVEAYSPQLSTFVTESMRFSQIISTAASGVIPRVIDNRMMLIYWKKSDSGHIIGCSIDMEMFIERLISILPPVMTGNRFLTVLDHNGTSVIPEVGFTPQNWNQPFVSREISRTLPRWETAIYIVNQQEVSSRAHATALIFALLAAILFVTIATSGFFMMKSMHTELTLARQKTTFVTNVSHELKTPLTSIRLFAELLRERRQKDPAKQDKYLGIIISETERLTRLINNVLDFARINRGKRTYTRKTCDLNELCKEVTENQRVRLEHASFTFTTQYSDIPLPVHADTEALKQALLNILSNAEKYSTVQRWIMLSVAHEGPNSIIRIADHGIGIDAAQAELIFKEFYRVDDSLTAPVQGTGLGLTITRQIIRDHGGDIRYRKNLPSGSEFIITLPLQTEENGEPDHTRC